MSAANKPVIFITGGSRGIGKALVEKFLSKGWLVATCATTLKSLENSPADFCFACNVADVNNVRDSINAIINKYGRLDAVINNAGIAGENSLDVQVNDDFWHDIINTNLHGTYYVCKYALPHLPDNKGRIVNIASVLGLKGVPDQTAYCSAKHGVLGFTKALAHYIAPRKITINAICPGWVRTDMMRGRMNELQLSESDLTSRVPLGKIIEPSEIADVAFYLIDSEAAANITGQAIPVDGGATL